MSNKEIAVKHYLNEQSVKKYHILTKFPKTKKLLRLFEVVTTR